jgi:site-specific DNA-methyltransferase (adenine-specific)
MKITMNKIITGNCLEVMKKEIIDKCIDLTVTSPPYDNLRNYEGYEFNFEGIANELYRVTKNGGIVVWIVGDATIKGSESGSSFKQALYFKEIGFNLHDTMIYQKSGFNFPANNRYHQIFEYMFVLSKGSPKTFNPILDRKNAYPGQVTHSFHRTQNGKRDMSIVKAQPAKEYGMRFNVWKYNTGGGQITSDREAHQHPAIFPEKLVEDHILSWSNEGDIVLDPMAGSGTTLKMAKKNNRNYIGIEISSEYVEIINKRLT